jgi:hypothetical protein
VALGLAPGAHSAGLTAFGTVLVRLVLGVLLVVVGLVWIGQGTGAIGGSFMSGQAIWAVFGAVALLFGLALLRGARRSRGDRAP